ncbi:MAG: hypothetical protein MZW92_48830 [Comamonadaceae bacterium]|nr:hypothetical protein [Comamonadaceae bacterium]
MRLLMVGAGGIGGYFGACLAAAGHDVTFVARGATSRRAARARPHGRERRSATSRAPRRGDRRSRRRCRPAGRRSFSRQAVGHRSGGGAIAPAARATAVSSSHSQNGVEASIASDCASLGADRVAGGVAQIGAAIKSARRDRRTRARWRGCASAPLPAGRAAAAEVLRRCRQAAGIDVERVDDIQRALWEKFVFLAALSGADGARAAADRRRPRAIPTCAATLRGGDARDRGGRRLRSGVDLGRRLRRRADWRFVDGLPARDAFVDAATTSSPAAGWRRRGCAGAVARMAAEAGIDAPINATLYAALKPYLRRARADRGGSTG